MSLEKIAPPIVQEKTIAVQNSYKFIFADSLRRPDYTQIESRLNKSRVRSKGKIAWKESRPRSQTMPQSKQLSAILRAEAHLLYRMMETPLVLNDYTLREDFAFATPEFQVLYDLLLDSMEIFLQNF